MSDPFSEAVETVPTADLIPTQVTVGMREVEVRRRRWREKHGHDAAHYLNKHRIPVILGPDARHYLIDRHHLTLALSDEGIWELPVSIVANMRGLGFEEFWKTLEIHNWTHPFDDQGPAEVLRKHAGFGRPPHRRSLSIVGRGAQEGWWIREG